MPSIGTRSDGRTRTTSPAATSPTGTSAKDSPRRTHAEVGVSLPSARIACRAWPMA
jgi:hypothetical protein